MSGSGTVAVDVTLNSESSFSFSQIVNTTGNNVVFKEGDVTFEVDLSGAYSLAFNATNFELANPPVIFEEGATWLLLQQGFTAQQFTLLLINAGFTQQQASFTIQEANGGTVDPTVVNNPNPPDVAVQEQRRERRLAAG